MNAPVLGAENVRYPDPGHWQFSFGWRYQKSDRHFVGSDEQEERQAEGSEVINRIHLLEVGIRYDLTRRSWLAASIPYLLAERSSPIRDASRHVIDRSITQARGISDIVVSAKRWMLDPADHQVANFALGLGLKVPTGENNVHDTRRTFAGGQIVSNVQTVDQSIQPGDGGFGFVVDAAGFAALGSRFDLYASASYLINPEATSGVLTYRGRESEAIMSIADQYLASLGVSTTVPGVSGLGVWLGGRLEGVPADDLIGSSRGFRRPGYAISVEPGVSWTRGDHSLALSVPVAVYRNRVRSYADRLDDRHGDAAFADHLVMFSYTLRR